MVIRPLLRYLVDHPDAKDTVQGVLRWWLPGDMSVWEEAAVRDALEELVARGWLTQRRIAFSQMLFGVNKEKLEDMKAFLRECDSEADGQRE